MRDSASVSVSEWPTGNIDVGFFAILKYVLMAKTKCLTKRTLVYIDINTLWILITIFESTFTSVSVQNKLWHVENIEVST